MGHQSPHYLKLKGKTFTSLIQKGHSQKRSISSIIVTLLSLTGVH